MSLLQALIKRQVGSVHFTCKLLLLLWFIFDCRTRCKCHQRSVSPCCPFPRSSNQDRGLTRCLAALLILSLFFFSGLGTFPSLTFSPLIRQPRGSVECVVSIEKEETSWMTERLQNMRDLDCFEMHVRVCVCRVCILYCVFVPTGFSLLQCRRCRQGYQMRGKNNKGFLQLLRWKYFKDVGWYRNMSDSCVHSCVCVWAPLEQKHECLCRSSAVRVSVVWRSERSVGTWPGSRSNVKITLTDENPPYNYILQNTEKSNLSI